MSINCEIVQIDSLNHGRIVFRIDLCFVCALSLRSFGPLGQFCASWLCVLVPARVPLMLLAAVSARRGYGEKVDQKAVKVHTLIDERHSLMLKT